MKCVRWGEIHYKGHWKGWAMKVETFLGPETTRAKRVLFGPKKVGTFMAQHFHGLTLPMAQVMPLPRIKIIRGKRHKKIRFIGNFMQMRTEWLFQGPKTLLVWAQTALALLKLFQGPKKSRLSWPNPSNGQGN